MNSRKHHITIVAALALACALALGVGPVLADVGNDGIFQIDGDVCGGGAIPTAPTCVDQGVVVPGLANDDWDNLFTCSGTEGNCVANIPPGDASEPPAFVFDPAPLSIFTEGGSKDEKDITEWRWKDGSVPDKDDIIEAFAAVYKPTVGPRAGHKILYFGANRLAVNGDADIGFWFFRNNVQNPGSGGSATPFIGQHAIGDILILSNFVNGGGKSNIQVFVVTAIPGDGSVTLTQPFGANTTLANRVCAGPNGDACAATNGSTTAALDPNFAPKSGTTGQYPPVSFFEGGADLTAIGFALGIPELGTECLASFMVETRSSSQISAVLKDFTLRAFEACTATITTEIHDPSHLATTSATPGTLIHDLAIVTGQAGAPTPTGTVTFKFFDGTNATTQCMGSFTTETFALGTLPIGGVQPNPEACPTTAPAGSVCVRSSDHQALPPGLSFSATYNGDTNYPDGATSQVCELLLVGQCDSQILTKILNCSTSSTGNTCTPGTEVTNTLIDLAGNASVALKDQATVSPAPTAGCTQTPMGTVTFTRFANGNCAGSGTSEIINLDGTGKALSSVFSLDATGLSYKAQYSGDTIYKASNLTVCEPVCAIDTTVQPTYP